MNGHSANESQIRSRRLAVLGRFSSVLVSYCFFWVFLNSTILARSGGEFDPYPYILLNLFIWMLASIQVPIIMMSQNRQAIKDRLDAQHDYEVKLKVETETANPHEKFDEMRQRVLEDLLAMQKEQLEILGQIRNRTQR